VPRQRNVQRNPRAIASGPIDSKKKYKNNERISRAKRVAKASEASVESERSERCSRAKRVAKASEASVESERSERLPCFPLFYNKNRGFKMRF